MSLNGRQKVLFALLAAATLFEGFDTKLASLVMPMLGRDFGVGPQALGGVLSATGVGMMLAFFVIRLADRWGRRPVMLVAIGGYALLTLATAFAWSVTSFTVLQFFARMLMVVELALAYVILGEELPPEQRGRGMGLLGAFATVGASLPAFFLAPLEAAGLGWRGLFALGALPLLLLPAYWRWLPEPALFRASAPTPALAGLRRLVGPGLGGRFVGVVALWWTVNFWSAAALFFFTLYAFEERGWTAGHLQWLPLGTIPVGFAGYWLAGQAMDRLGRRPAATLYLLGGTAAALVCYRSQADAWIYGAYFALMGMGGVWTVASTITTELFPTELRATAMGLANNLLGRTGIVVGPAVTGALSAALESTADAVSLLACLNLACVPLLWWLLPETRATDLERVGSAS